MKKSKDTTTLVLQRPAESVVYLRTTSDGVIAIRVSRNTQMTIEAPRSVGIKRAEANPISPAA